MATTELLKKGTLFEMLTEEELEDLAKIVKERDVIAGDYVFDEGSEANCLFIVKHGAVEIIKSGKSGDDLRIAAFSSGVHFGEMAFVDRQPRAAGAMATENTKLLEVPFDALEAVVRKNADVGLKIYKALAQALCRRIRNTTNDFTSLKDLKLRHS